MRSRPDPRSASGTCPGIEESLEGSCELLPDRSEAAVNAVGTRLDVVEERRPVAKPDQLGEIEMTTTGNLPELVSRKEWLVARMELLLKEKELTRARDRVNADRRRLPMVRIDKP
jgi:hypothetical protein